MKRAYTILVFISLMINLVAQVPEKMSYQAVIRDADNKLVTNQTVGIQISILQGTANGTEVYVETQAPVTNANGLVSIEIGGGDATIINGDFSLIDWSNGPYFIKTETDLTGGTNYTITGTSQLLSVPYALYAKEAGDGFSGDYNDLSNKPTGLSEFINDAGYIKQFSDSIVLKAPNGTLYKISVQNDGTLAAELLENFLTDIDGNVYKTVNIGTQVWMAENLRTTRYNDGTPIPLDTAEWIDKCEVPGYCWYDNDSDTYAQTYGALYNWYTVEMGMLCPEGWHIPADEEWTILVNYLGGKEVAGGKLKETGNTHWKSPNTGATNETGFTALPGGYSYGTFDGIGDQGKWWTSTWECARHAYTRIIQSNDSACRRIIASYLESQSIRCVKDPGTKFVLLDDVSLEINGGENIIQNNNFSDGLMHWNSWDDQQSACRTINNSDFISEPSSYSINAGTMPGFVRTFYDLEEQTFDWIFDSIDPYVPENSIWFSVIKGSTINLSYRCKGIIDYAHILGLDSSGNCRNLSSGGGGHPGIWIKVQKSVVVPEDIVAIGLQFDVVF